MYHPIKGGSMVLVQGLECHLPPPGYVFNKITSRLEKREIYSRSPRKMEQYWERLPVPEWFKEKEKEALQARKDKRPYSDPQYNKYAQQEWDRRINGFWFMRKGVPTYITGANYTYLQWWKIDIGYPKFRVTDMEYFYFQEYCIEDPICMGLAEVTKRRCGKTFRAGLFVYDHPSSHEQSRGGIQSKTGTDAKKVFSKAVISPFKKLPLFFRPEYDEGQGLTPKKELLFQQTTIKGKKSSDVLDHEELESGLDWQTSEEVSYDGQKLIRYVSDEFCKTTEVNVADRHEVIRYCLLDDEGNIIGKALYTSTVEEMEKGGGSGKKIWLNSNQYEVRNEDGTTRKRKKDEPTPSGLYRFFTDARRTRYFDKYGEPDSARAEKEILADRARVAHDQRALSARIRKEPFSEEEAFRIDGDQCQFNAMKLNAQRSELSYRSKDIVERGNLVWKDGVRDSSVVWEANPNGRWRILKGFNPKPEEMNRVRKVGSLFFPQNGHRFGSSCDPYDHDITEDDRRSSAASLVKQKCNPSNPGDELVGTYVLLYLARPNTSDEFYEDMIKQHFWLGCPMLFENQKQGIKKYFERRGYLGFLMKLKGYKDVGIPSTPENKGIGMDLVEAMIENNCHKIYFMEAIEQALEFDVRETQKYDVTMTMLWTEVACMNSFQVAQLEGKRDITDFFRLRKVGSN